MCLPARVYRAEWQANTGRTADALPAHPSLLVVDNVNKDLLVARNERRLGRITDDLGLRVVTGPLAKLAVKLNAQSKFIGFGTVGHDSTPDFEDLPPHDHLT